MIGVIDSKICNIYSLTNMLKKIGADYIICESPAELNKVNKIVMPGVGAFPKAIENLTKSGLKDGILKLAEKGMPLLGICLGMQLLFDESDEFGKTQGLKLIPGIIRKIKTNRILPHMGWNDITINHDIPLLNGIKQGVDVYFVHSFMAETDERYIAAYTIYDEKIPAIVYKDNIFGAQFHPEKSMHSGEQIMRSFANL